MPVDILISEDCSKERGQFVLRLHKTSSCGHHSCSQRPSHSNAGHEFCYIWGQSEGYRSICIKVTCEGNDYKMCVKTCLGYYKLLVYRYFTQRLFHHHLPPSECLW